MQQGFGLGGRIYRKHYVICVVWVRSSFCRVSFTSCLFLVKSHFLSLDLSMFKARSLSRLWTDMGLMYPLAEYQQQCQRICFYSVNELILSCFYWASLWLWQFLLGNQKLEIFGPSFLCVWSQMSLRNLQIRVSPRGFLHKFLLRFDGLSESVMLRISFSENHFDPF